MATELTAEHVKGYVCHVIDSGKEMRAVDFESKRWCDLKLLLELSDD